MEIKYKKSFTKSFKKLNESIQNKTILAIKIFQKNHYDELLRNHELKWKYEWCRSIDITWDYRAIFREYPNWTYEFIDFIEIWTHSQLYK